MQMVTLQGYSWRSCDMSRTVRDNIAIGEERPIELKPTKEASVARKTVLVSDLSGNEIRDEKDSAQIVIKYGDARRGQVTLDVLASEVDDLASKGRKTARRGRKPKATAV
jgi:hypothetical protein